MEGKQCYRTRGLATRPPAGLSAGVLLFFLLVQSLFKTFSCWQSESGGKAESCAPVAKTVQVPARPVVLVCLNLKQAERLKEHRVEVLRFQFPLELTPAHPGKRCQGPGHQL